MKFDPQTGRRASIRTLRPYYKAPTEPLLRLDQNTNLTGPNPAIARLDAARDDLSLYPTRDADPLVAALEKHHDLPPESVTCTNGSDEALDLIFKAYTEPGDTLLVVDPSYSLYPFYAALHALEYEKADAKQDWRPDLDALLTRPAKVTLVASPNNPTGRAAGRDELERFIMASQGLVVIDEAYAEYHDAEGLLPLIREHRNLIVMRTFSKAYALAGIRLGWLAAHPDTTEALRLVKPPFNVGLTTERLGILALEEQDFVHRSVDTVKTQRPRLQTGLQELGYHVVPSDANFLLAFPAEDAPDGPRLVGHLREHGIAARSFGDHPRLKRAIRFTIGTSEHTDTLLAALEKILKKGGPAQ